MSDTNIDIILDRAIDQLSQGYSLDEVLTMHEANKDVLKPLLQVVTQTMELPLKAVPSPRKQFKFVHAQQTKPDFKVSAWGSLMGIMRLGAFPLSLLLALTGTITAAHFVQTSLPGQPFFAVKKATERLPLALNKNSNQVTQLQLELTQKRLDEAETVIKSGDSADEQKVAALNELSSQTKDTLATLQAATTDKQSSKADNKALLSSLDDLSKKQEALVKEVNKSSDTVKQNPPVIAAAQETTDNVANIKKIIAASNDSSLTTLPVSVTGYVTSVSATAITIDQTTFVIDADTKILKNGIVATVDFIKPKMKVRVTGDKSDNNVLAKEIILLDNNSVSITGTEKTAPKKTDPTTEPDSTSSQQQTLKTGFIPEDPSPQQPQ